MALGPGSIAFTGYNSDDPDAISFVALEDIPANTVIFITDNNWNGTAFTTNEGILTFTATTAITAGTVVSLSSVNATATATTGTVSRNTTAVNFTNTNEAVFAYTGTAAAPVFLTAFANGANGFTVNNTLAGTGLVAGTNALDLSNIARADIAAYTGSRVAGTSFAEYATLINTPGNWTTQFGTNSQAADGIAPDLPFSTTAFTVAAGGPGTLSIGTVAIAEGGPGDTPSLIFTVSRPNGSTGAVTVDYAVTAETATAGTDYTIVAPTGTLSFGINEISKTVTVTVVGDYAIEPDETVKITLTAPTGGATLGNAMAIGTITNDDAIGSFAVSAPTFAEGTTGTSGGAFTITRTGGATGSVTIDYVVNADGTGGRVGSDDGLVVTGGLTGSVTFAQGETSKTVPFTVTGDRTVETNETIPITISTTTPGALIGTAAASATVTNDDVAGSVSIASTTVSEGDGTVTLTVTRSGGTGDFTVGYATADGTALAGGDYLTTTGTLAFTGGDTTRTIVVPIVNDTTPESDEGFTVTLSAPTSGATIGTGSATVTIFDNDTAAVAGSVSVAAAQIVEGNSGTADLIVTLTRTGGTAAFTVSYATTDGGRSDYASATTGSDYTATSGIATFGTGVDSVTVTIPVIGDTIAELSEEFRLLLSNPSNGATIGTGSALLTIVNDDTLPASTRIFTESFDSFTAAGFAPTPGAGQLSSNIWRITGMSDAPAPAYGFTGVAGGDFGRGLIVNNESGGGVYSPTGAQALVVQPTGTDFAPGSFIESRIQNLSGAAATAFDVGFDWAYRNNEQRGEVLSFAWSTDGTTFTSVPAAGFTIPEASDTTGFVLAPRTASLTGLSVADQGYLYLRWTYVSTSGTGSRDEFGIDNVIVNRVGGSALPTVSVSDVSVSEAAGTMTFTVTRTNAATGAFTVGYVTGQGSAQPVKDYDTVFGTLNFTENQVSATVTVAIVNDTIAEFDETFAFNLINPQGATVVRSPATGTIVNDDGVPIQVAINNPSVLEGDSGTIDLVYVVTRTGGTGAFDVGYDAGYETSNNTATVGSDFAPTRGTLSFAAGEMSKTFTVTVNGDTVTEPNETLVARLSDETNGAIVTSRLGTGTILNDEITLISAIQGNSYFSPIVAGAGIAGFGTGASTTSNATGFTVTVRAVVTAIDATGTKQGFYITEETSDWDSSALTSEGIFVMTSTDTANVGTAVMTAVPGLVVGQIVTVTANVMEYRPFSTNGPQTVLVNPVVTLGALGQPLPTLTLDAARKIPNALLTGVVPDYTDSVDDPGDSFDATNFAMSFFETIEGMLVTVPDVRVADGFFDAQRFKVYSAVSANAEQINTRGGYTIAGDPVLSPPDTASTLDNVIAGGKGVTDGDINPDILELDFSDFAIPLSSTPVTTGANGNLSMGDRLGDVTGFIEWNFTDMKLIPTALSGTYVDTVLTKELTTIAPNDRALTFATFNVENLAGNADQSRFDKIAAVIASNLGAPAILSIEEIQDNNGGREASQPTTVGAGDGISATGSDASTTWSLLVAAVNTATGKVYQWVDQAPVYNAEGGQSNGNIRVGFLYDTGRVQLGNLDANAPIEERRKFVDRLGDNARDPGDLIAYSDNMVSGIATSDYTTTRLSLLGQFTFNGNTVFAMANHLPSKGGSGKYWDAGNINPQNGTPTNSDWTQRSNIGEDIYTLLNYIQTQNASARILSGGDFNDFYFYRPLETATGYVFANGLARNDGARLVNLALALPEAERYTYTFDGRSQAIDHILADAASAAVATTDVVHINSGFAAANRISDHDPVLTAIDLRNFAETLNGTVGGETISGFGGDDIIDGRGGTDTLIGGTGNDVFYVDSLDDIVTELANEGTDEIRTTLVNYVLPANVELLTLLGSGGNDVFAGSGDANRFDISQGGSDTVNAGGGDDGIYAAAALDATDRIDGGAGTLDQVALQGAYGARVTLAADTIRNVEMLVFLPGNDTRFGASGTILSTFDIKTDDGNVATGQTLTIQGNALRAGETLTFDGSAELDGSFRTYGGLGSDVVTGGQRDDGFYFGQGRFNTGDRVDGQGGGADQIGLQGDFAGANALTFGASQIANVESIVVLSGADTRFGGGGSLFSYTLTMDDGNVATGGTMVVQGNSLRAGEVLTLNAAAEANATYRVFGGAAADTITTGGGNDELWARVGADVLRGGAGTDVFGYVELADSTTAARDRILDFVHGDLIDVSRVGFTSFIGGATFTGAGQLRATHNGTAWIIDGDIDGNGSIDLSIEVAGDASFVWTANDFRLATPVIIDSHALVA